MILGITGGTGFIGTCIREEAKRLHHKTILFTRHPEENLETRKFTIDTVPDVRGCDALIHLAGESVVGWWTQKKRRAILESRREGTRRLVEGIAQSPIKPRILISSSSIGYYGDTADQIIDETSPAGQGFLAEVAQVWEEEALKAEQYGVRVVLLRTGLVLGRHGGLMKRLRPLFCLGLGGKLGSGEQWMSCIEIHDFVRLALYCCHDESIKGPVNLVIPSPVTNAEFTETLADTVNRSAFFNIPEFLLRFMLGEFSSLLLSSQRILPNKALQLGFEFQYPTIRKSLEESLRAF